MASHVNALITHAKGKKIIETGPLYLKTVENGRIEIGKNVFFNHNCSMTSMESVKIGDDCFLEIMLLL